MRTSTIVFLLIETPIYGIFLFGVWGFFSLHGGKLMTLLENWQSLIGAIIGVLVAYLLFAKQRRLDQKRSENAIRAKFTPSIEIADTIAKSLQKIAKDAQELTHDTHSAYNSPSSANHFFHLQFDELFGQIGSEIKITQHRITFLDQADHQGCNIRFFEAKHALTHLLTELSSIFNSTNQIYKSSGGLNSSVITKHHAVCTNLQRLILPIRNNQNQTTKMKTSLENAIQAAI